MWGLAAHTLASPAPVGGAGPTAPSVWQSWAGRLSPTRGRRAVSPAKLPIVAPRRSLSAGRDAFPPRVGGGPEAPPSCRLLPRGGFAALDGPPSPTHGRRALSPARLPRVAPQCLQHWTSRWGDLQRWTGRWDDLQRLLRWMLPCAVLAGPARTCWARRPLYVHLRLPPTALDAVPRCARGACAE